MDFEAGIAFLRDAGLNLTAVLRVSSLPNHVMKTMQRSGAPIIDYENLVLIGHGGQRLWDQIQVRGMKTADPVDHYSVSKVEQFLERYLDHPPVIWLYPNTSFVVPLQQLGSLAGWSFESPLGLGINPEFGLWFAYRAAFVTNSPLPTRSSPLLNSPCDSCIDRPCLQSCPSGAVRLSAFDVESCATYRVQPLSSCSDRCHARLACPQSPEHRYRTDQIRYHYEHSLATLKTWYRS